MPNSKLLSLSFALLALMPMTATAQEAARPAKVAIVMSSATAFERQYPAIVEPLQEAVLSFRVSGRVVELPIHASMSVSKGDVIAKLDPRDFKTQIAQLQSQKDQAASQLEALKAGARPGEIAALQAGIDAVQAQLVQATEQLGRTKKLVARGVATTSQLEQDEAAVRVAEAQLRAKQEEMQVARTGARAEEVAAAEAVIRGLDTQLQAARDNLADATLRAPFDGIIARRDIENFTNLQAGQDVVLLQQLSTVALAFDVPGPDVVTFSDAKEVSTSVTLNALPGQKLPAELIEFTTQADAATQTYRGRVAVSIPEGARILPGMVGSIVVQTQNNTLAQLSIPLSALGANADGSPFVWVVDGETNTVRNQPVKLGEAAGAEILVLEGLKEGDVVVSAGVSRLQDGMVIRPITKVGG